MKIRFPQFITVALLAVVALSTSCSTDFDLNAPYETTPIVYGFIDQSVDTQYVKINRTYLGTGDNATYASINDSTIFKNVEATVDEVINGNVTNSWTLQEKIVTNVDEGAFYDGTQKVYYFVPLAGIQEEATYKFRASINEGEKIVTAETDVVGNVNFTNANILAPPSGINLASVNSISGGVYPNLEINWVAAENGKKYEISMMFYYTEYLGADTLNKSLVWNLGATASSSFNVNSNGENFYQRVQNKLNNNANESNVIKRTGDSIEFVITVADQTFNTYLEVNEPSLSLVSERPAFSNVEGGLGIFASRNRNVLKRAYVTTFNLASYRELCLGQYTSSFKFCALPLSSYANNTVAVSPSCP